MKIDGEPIDTAERFERHFAVSRETISRLEAYAALIVQWQKAVNLVAPSTLGDLWHRHFADSAQIVRLLPDTARRIVDLGSGGGFPGLVVAILLVDQGRLAPKSGADARAGLDSEVALTLVESDQRKAAFLREAARQLSLPVNILSTRIENTATQSKLTQTDVVTARALAPLSKLLELSVPLIGQTGVAVFLKGRDAQAEVASASEHFAFECQLVPSITDRAASIVVARGVEPRRRADP